MPLQVAYTDRRLNKHIKRTGRSQPLTAAFDELQASQWLLGDGSEWTQGLFAGFIQRHSIHSSPHRYPGINTIFQRMTWNWFVKITGHWQHGLLESCHVQRATVLEPGPKPYRKHPKCQTDAEWGSYSWTLVCAFGSSKDKLLGWIGRTWAPRKLETSPCWFIYCIV